jgi:hypothetical protein
MDMLKTDIKKILDITEEEDVRYFINIGIISGDSTAKGLCQEAYVDAILRRFKMEDCKIRSVPMTLDCKLVRAGKTADEYPFRQAVGMVQYLANSTRPDISFVGSHLGQFSNYADCSHWSTLKNVLRYLKGTKGLMLKIEGTEEDLLAFCDADWGSDVVDRRSYTGFVILLGGTPIAWKAKKQTCTSLSTQEAEYIALSECAKELLWIGELLQELGLKKQEDLWPIRVRCDSTSAIKLARNAIGNTRSKHIDLKYHFIRDCIEQGSVTVEYVSGNDNAADILTKALGNVKFKKFLRMLNMGWQDKDRENEDRNPDLRDLGCGTRKFLQI